MAHDRFRILFVCTGNICRSPMAEGLVRHALAASRRHDADGVVAESAGVHGFEDAPMDAHAAATLRHLGGDPEPFRSRRLSGEMVEAADLILTAGREHRAAVLSLDPRALRRSFTILEFARLVRDVDLAEINSDGTVAGFRSLLLAASSRRGRVAPVNGTDDELADPYGGPAEGFRLCGEQVTAALDWVPRLLATTSDARTNTSAP